MTSLLTHNFPTWYSIQEQNLLVVWPNCTNNNIIMYYVSRSQRHGTLVLRIIMLCLGCMSCISKINDHVGGYNIQRRPGGQIIFH
jgi:hypothetical protein